MADNVPVPSSLPPQPNAASPTQPFVPPQSAQGNTTHMQPSPMPPPVVIPQTHPIPSSVTSPMTSNMMSPTSAGGFVRRAAPEPNKRALYVGGLDPRVTEDILRQIFETTGHVQSVKIIPDKNVRVGFPLLLPRNPVTMDSSILTSLPLSFMSNSSTEQRLELWFCRIRRPRRGRSSHADTPWPPRSSVGG